jgi:PIN domain nuclease of toxin-antitoxin system
VILLDTNALLWVHQGHRRGRPLAKRAGRLYVSPVSLLEVQFLLEAGRIRLRGGDAADLVADSRWLVDEPPALAWFQRGLELGWTRDPFDRLLVAHARYRGWRLATGDGELLARLGTGGFEL